MADQMEMTRTSSPDGKRKRRGGPRRKTGMSYRCMSGVAERTGVHPLAISHWVTCIHSLSFSATRPGLVGYSVIADVLIRMVSGPHVSC